MRRFVVLAFLVTLAGCGQQFEQGNEYLGDWSYRRMDEEGRHFIEVMTITKNGANYLVTTTHPNFVSPGISDRTDPGIYHDGMIAALGRDMAHIKSPDSVVWLGTTYYRGRTGTP